MRRLRTVVAVALLATATLAAVRGAEAIVRRDPAAPLTPHLLWLAPVGIGSRTRSTSQSEAVSAWEHQQLHIEHELDQRLIICTGADE